MAFTVPGVYVKESVLFPPSIAPVATGVPAFVGYTELVKDSQGKTLINKPFRLTSMMEFTELFGVGYNPAAYSIQIDKNASNKIVSVKPKDGKQFYLYHSMQHYFDNGGGPCYVVTVGDYSEDVTYKDPSTQRGLHSGVKALEKVDEPTILVCPESVALKKGDGSPDFVKCGNLHTDILNQCAGLKDRFGILDVMEGYQPPNGTATDPIKNFRDNVGTMNLDYGAAYYPWLYSTYFKNVRYSQLSFVDSSPSHSDVPYTALMTGNTKFDNLLKASHKRLSEENLVFSKFSEINRDNYESVSTYFSNLQKDVINADSNSSARNKFKLLLQLIRNLALTFPDLDSSMASVSLMRKLDSLKNDSKLQTQIKTLIAFEKTVVRDNVLASYTDANVNTEYDTFNHKNNWIGGGTVNAITALSSTSFNEHLIVDRVHSAANSVILQKAFDVISKAFISVAGELVLLTDQADQNLFTQHPFFKTVYDRVRREMSLIPPSGAVAGIYSATNRTRGVWKAPANVSLQEVIAPACKLDDTDQSGLNVTDTGKSVNAIRSFTGSGILIWGARTLDGNSNDWRYVNVRRFFIFVEESAKKATESFVFESNNANTWLRVRTMIENFLTIQWRQGALAGAKPNQAFYVKIGLGETMTDQDILEGRMIVEIGLAVARPAEFIILRFTHKMQES